MTLSRFRCRCVYIRCLGEGLFSEDFLEELFGFLENVFGDLYGTVLGVVVDLDRFVAYLLGSLDSSFLGVAVNFD